MDRVRDDLLTAEQRLTAIAHILAGALLRLRGRAALPQAPQGQEKIPPESAPNCLEVPGQPRLSVHSS
jgi:hypothetical protein